MNEKQRQARFQRWGEYRGFAYRRWRVYSTFLTGFLIGLFYVLLISGRFFPGIGPEGQRALVLVFSGILGGVIYTIVVDEHVEMPRFVGSNGDQFEAGLFGDILLGIAGAVVLDYIRRQLGVELETGIEQAAAGMVGGYGGRAVLQFALTRVFKDINLLEADRQKYLQSSVQRRMEGMDSLKLIDQLNQQIRVGLASAELAELKAELKQADSDVKKRAFDLAQDFRRSANLSGEKSRIERTIPIFEALIESDPQHHPYYGELAFAYKDSGSPDLFQTLQYLDKAITLRGDQQRAETWKYELIRAITRIQEAYKISNSYNFDPAVNERIIADLLAVAEIYNLTNILKEAAAKKIPVPIMDWMQQNQSLLSAHSEASVLIKKLDSLIGTELPSAQPQEVVVAASQNNFEQSKHSQQTTDVSSASNASASVKQAANSALPKSAPIQPAVSDSAVPNVVIALIQEVEGYHKELPDGRAKAYPDPLHGWKVPTIGFGTTRYPDGRKVQEGDTITRNEAERYLLTTLEHNCKGILEKIPTWKQMNSNQRAALYSFAYNLGESFYRGKDFDSITRVCDSPDRWSDHGWIAAQFEKYRDPGSSVEEGLRKRRLAEASLFCKPVLAQQVSSNDQRTPSESPLMQFVKNQSSILPDLIAKDNLLSRHIQEVLIRFNLLEAPADGKFGPLSADALFAFQDKMGQKIPDLLKEKGFLGPLTAKALIENPLDLFPKPQLNLGNDLASRIIKYMQAKQYQIFTKEREYNIVYVEGMNVDGTLNDDLPDCFNDVRMVIEFKEGKPQIVGKWEGTTEPGRSYTYNPMNSKGAARIKFGQYKAWQVDQHCGESSGCHEALVQTGTLTVHRDFNKDMKRTNDRLDTNNDFGINQHWGFDAPKNNIGTASAGCLVGRSRQGHKEFMAIIKQDKRYLKNNQYTFFTTIIPGDDLEKGVPD